jgi:outer membrane protein OmpA-like peptidoglycan-associated protein
MTSTIIKFVNVFILLCLAWTTPTFALPQDDYEAPPSGIEWGWQAQVFFKINSAKLRTEDKPTLNRLATTLLAHPEISLLITGHADKTGNLALNQKLSGQRVNAVRSYLLKKGVASTQVTMQSLGEQRPVANDACPADRERNRRADLAFFPTGSPPPASRPVHADESTEPGECEEAEEDARP